MSGARSGIRSNKDQLNGLGYLRQFAQSLIRGDSYCRNVLDVLPAAIYVIDAAGGITYYNEAAATFWGYRPELGKSRWCGSWKLFWPDGRPLPHDECFAALALKQGRPIHGMEAVAERPDGSRIAFISFPTPLYDSSGRLAGAVNMLVDITDRQRAEENAQRLASIIESSDDAIGSTDLNGLISSWNRGAERLFGYPAKEIIGKPCTILMPSERQDEASNILERIRSDESIGRYETVRQRKDGSLVEISLTVSPIRNTEGTVIGASVIAHDITELRRARAQERLLLNEMKHRVKNTLTTVQAVAVQTLRGISGDERDAFTARLQALAAAHDLLTDENWHRASLREVVVRTLAAFQEQHCQRVLIEGPENVWLGACKSLQLAMAMHELATNAVKYGALSNGSGQVKVHWELLDDGGSGRVRLCWKESGGPPVKSPERKGFGSFLLEHVLEGEPGATCFEFMPEGLACTFEVPL
jgi:PAS domain S-box-containing protein